MNSPLTMNSLSEGYRALVIGASGALGSAFCELLNQDPRCAYVRELGRNSVPCLDLEDADSIAKAAAELTEEAPYQLIVHAAGLLHRDEIKPEKSYSAIEADALQSVFQINTFCLLWFCVTSCCCWTLMAQWRCSLPRWVASAITA